MPRAIANHILVDTEQQAIDLRAQIVDDGASFGDLARAHSSCPSGKEGGSLGEFAQGAMVPEFDAVIFGDIAIGEVSEPVKTEFGFHLIQVEKRIG